MRTQSKNVSGVLWPVPGSPIQERGGQTGPSQGKGHKNDFGIRAPVIQAEAETPVQPGEGQVSLEWGLTNVCECWMGDNKRPEPVSSSGIQQMDRRQWTQIAIQEIPFKHMRKLFGEGGRGCPERSRSLSILGDIPNLKRHCPGQPAPADPAFSSEGCTTWPPEVPSSFNYTVILRD